MYLHIVFSASSYNFVLDWNVMKCYANELLLIIHYSINTIIVLCTERYALYYYRIPPSLSIMSVFVLITFKNGQFSYHVKPLNFGVVTLIHFLITLTKVFRLINYCYQMCCIKNRDHMILNL